MIANEMQRASALLSKEDVDSRRRSYERVLRLVDLTIMVQTKPALRRELLRWRDLVAALYLGHTDAPSHRDALVSLLQLTPASFRQIAYLT
jgi:hypothetical protein